MRNVKFVFIMFVGLCFAIVACSSENQAQSATNTPANPSPTLTTPNDSSEVPTPSPTDTPQPDPIVPPLDRYSLVAVLDYDSHKVSVEEQITYLNSTGIALSELLLLIEPNRYPGGFDLETLSWDNGEPILNYSLTEHQLLISLASPLSRGESLVINISYGLVLPNQNAPYGYTDRQTNLGDWYPYIPPYIKGEGWLVRDVAFLGEHLAFDMADFEVEIQLANPNSANGAQLIIAASSLPVIDGEIYRYHHKPARNFAWTVSDQYQVQETQAGDVVVKSYSFPFHPLADEPAMQETAKSLSLFSELFSPYPHESLSVVEADFLDGMEYDGLIFLSHAFYDFYTGDQRSNLTIIAAHEVAHQWWYALIGNDQALEPWLDEALSTFSELYFYENAYPDLVDWWWENRITFHEPQGWVDSTIYDASGFYPYRDAVYLRGAMFLGELRDVLGEDAFLEFMRDYLGQFRYRQVNGDDFFNLLNEYTDTDLSALISTYFNKR
jgi:hypothetical protein